MLVRYGYPEQSYFQMKVLHPEKVGKILKLLYAIYHYQTDDIL